MSVWGTEEPATASSPSRRSVARRGSGPRRIGAVALVAVVASAGLAITEPASAAPVAARSVVHTQLGQPKAQGIPGLSGTTASVVFGVENTGTTRRIPTKARVDLLGGARPVSLGKVQLPGIASGKSIRMGARKRVPSTVPAGSYAVRVCLGTGTSALCRTSARSVKVLPAHLTVSTPSVSFAPTPVGGWSTTRQIRVTNTGQSRTGALAASSGSGGAFAVAASTCRASLTPGASCTVGVRFTPAAAGAATGSLQVRGRAGETVTVALTGTGTSTAPAPTPPVLAISESAHDFGYDDAPAPHVFTVTNTGASTATAVTTSLTGDPAFVDASTCGAVLPSTSSCSVSVTYAGSGTTQQSARLEVASDNGGTVGADLKGSPVALSVTPAEHAFGEVAVGSTSQSASFVLTNHRLTSVTLDESTTGPFASDDSCDAVAVPAGGTCAFTATFNPAAAGPVSGDVSYTAGADGAQVELSGAGTTPAALSVTTSVSDLGAYEVDGTPGTTVLTVTNTGTTSTGAIDADLDGSVDDFAVTGSTCPEALPGGGSCEITVAFSPASDGDKSVDVAVSGAPGNTVTLTGLGAPAGVSLVPVAYDYGTQPVGSTTLKTFRVVNTTGTSQEMNSASTGPAFPFELNEDFTCVLVITDIPSHRWCTMTMSFKPQSTGSFSATLTASGPSFTITSTLFGTGAPPAGGRQALRRTASADTGGASRIELKDGETVVSR